MFHRHSILFVLLLIGASSLLADATPIDDLCAAGIEGTYDGKLGTRNFRYNLICIEDGRLIGILGDMTLPGTTMQYFTNTQVDGDSLVIATFPLKNEDRHGISSKATMTYFKVKVATLKGGRLEGFYRNGSLDHMPVVSARKVANFPHYACDPKRGVDSAEMTGAFRFNLAGTGHGVLLSDILLGTPIMTLVYKGQDGQQMMDGPAWDGSGCFTSFNAEGDGEVDARPLFVIRGQWKGPGQIEFYYVNYQGMHGPVTGQRP